MRIISKYKDYYDGLSDFSDKSHTWSRNQQTIWINPNTDCIFKDVNIPMFQRCFVDFGFNTNNINIGLYVLLFCGNIYPLWKIDDEYFIDFHQDVSNLIGYDIESFNNIINQLIKITKCKYTNIISKQYGIGCYIVDLFNKQYVQQYNNRLKQLHFRFNSPILLLTAKVNRDDKSYYNHKFYKNCRISVNINPNLSDINFYKMLSPMDCYQQLDTFLFNELFTTEKTIPEIDNKSKIQSKGFDIKYSFRKDSIKKQ